MFITFASFLLFYSSLTMACFPQQLSNGIDDSEYCLTSECENIAKIYAASINKSFDPCEDFYSFVCYGWKEKHKIPTRKSQWDMFSKLYFNVLEKLHESLEYFNLATSEIEKKVHNLYKGCMREINIESSGIKQLRKILNNLGGWPILGYGLQDNYDWLNSLVWITKNLGAKTFILSLYVAPDRKNTSKYILYIDQSSLGIGMNELLNTSSSGKVRTDIDYYREIIFNIVYRLHSWKDIFTIKKEINELIEFEASLASFSKSNVERKDKEKLYNKMTVRELQEIFGPNVNITSYLRKILEDIFNVSDDMEIVVPVPEYMKKLGELIGKTNKKVIANYIGWRVMLRFSSFTIKSFRDYKYGLMTNPIGSEREKPLHEYCLETINILLEYALGSIYVKNHFSHDIKDDILEMVKEVKYAFKDIIKESEWIDYQTKSVALRKLKHMIPIIGYPSWIVDDDKIHSYYEMLGNITEDDFLESSINILQFMVKKELLKLTLNFDRNSDWATSPINVNAYYNANANGLFLSAAMLQFPFYQYGLPVYINFGSFGNVIGHEMTHAFDDEGSLFDEFGNLRNWWTPNVKRKFKKKIRMFHKPVRKL
ncbi:neprilysin-1-like [Centruroides vittatus]|uniref:neprilysin-1-like n=1 Tax=Centruroides vittatus TaxID=120091 RepID=UPI00350FF9A5